MSYVAERFSGAVKVLLDDGPIKLRLSRAYTEHLQYLDETELPGGLRAAFASLRAALNRVTPVGKESRVKASVQKMSTCEAAAHAEAILELYVGLVSRPHRAEPLKVVNNRAEDRRSAANGVKPPRYLTSRP